MCLPWWEKNEKEAEDRRRITEKKKTERKITEIITIVRNMANCLEQ